MLHNFVFDTRPQSNAVSSNCGQMLPCFVQNEEMLIDCFIIGEIWKFVWKKGKDRGMMYTTWKSVFMT